MIVTRWKGGKKVVIPINKYLINWDKSPSQGQQILQNFLVTFWRNDIVIAEMRIPGCLKRFDIVNCNKKIIVEYSPLTHHNTYNKFFHRSRAGYLKSIKSDAEKAEWAERNGFKLVEIVEKDLPLLSRDYFYKQFGVQL